MFCKCKTAERLAQEGEEYNMPIVLRLELNILEPNIPQRHHAQGKDRQIENFMWSVFGLT